MCKNEHHSIELSLDRRILTQLFSDWSKIMQQFETTNKKMSNLLRNTSLTVCCEVASEKFACVQQMILSQPKIEALILVQRCSVGRTTEGQWKVIIIGMIDNVFTAILLCFRTF